jgi:hypothetical protein
MEVSDNETCEQPVVNHQQRVAHYRHRLPLLTAGKGLIFISQSQLRRRVHRSCVCHRQKVPSRTNAGHKASANAKMVGSAFPDLTVPLQFS